MSRQKVTIWAQSKQEAGETFFDTEFKKRQMSNTHPLRDLRNVEEIKSKTLKLQDGMKRYSVSYVEINELGDEVRS